MFRLNLKVSFQIHCKHVFIYISCKHNNKLWFVLLNLQTCDFSFMISLVLFTLVIIQLRCIYSRGKH